VTAIVHGVATPPTCSAVVDVAQAGEVDHDDDDDGDDGDDGHSAMRARVVLVEH